MVEVAIALSVLATGGSVAAAALAVAAMRRSAPAQVVAALEGAQAEVVRLGDEWAATKLRLASTEEEIQGMLDAVEKKRRRIAATESKRAAAEEPSDPRMALRRQIGIAQGSLDGTG